MRKKIQDQLLQENSHGSVKMLFNICKSVK